MLARTYTRQLSPRLIETKYGKLRGLLVDIPNKNVPAVEAFLGLQYASLLGGQLRFMPPTAPMEKWGGVRVALRYRPACPQRLYTEAELKERLPHMVEHFKRLAPYLRQQSEECLNLNLYVPQYQVSTLLKDQLFFSCSPYMYCYVYVPLGSLNIRPQTTLFRFHAPVQCGAARGRSIFFRFSIQACM